MDGSSTDREKLEPYSLGAPVAGRRLHLNEYRRAPAPGVEAAVRAAAAEAPASALLAEYPPGAGAALLRRLAAYAGAPGPECIAVAAGSDEVLRAAVDTCGARAQGAVVVGVPTYTHFVHFARVRGLRVCEYPLMPAEGELVEDRVAEAEEAGAGRLQAYHAAELERGALVYLGSPNNPTGGLWREGAVAALARRYPRSLFLVDEAYTEFAGAAAAAPPPGAGGEFVEDAKSVEDRFGHKFAKGEEEARAALNACSLAPLAARTRNVVVARTFSKAFGLAALRAGYAVGAPETVAELGLSLSPKAFTALAGVAAAAALEALPHYLAAARAALADAAALAAALEAAGWPVRRAPARSRKKFAGDAPRLVAALAARGVAVRDRSALPGLAGFVRITAGSAEDCAAVRAAFAGLDPAGFRAAGSGGAPPAEEEKAKADDAKFVFDQFGHKPVVYADGVFDLFHSGHLEFLRKARAAGGPGARLVVGVISDEAAGWKRRPVASLAQRLEMVRCCRLVDEAVGDPPLVLTAEFLDARGITLVVHGDDDRQEDFFRVPLERGVMRYVPYTRAGPLAVSTTALVARIRARPDLAAAPPRAAQMQQLD